MSFASLLRQTCSLQRLSLGAADSWGQPSKSYVTETGIKCRLMTTSGREIESREHGGLVISHHKLFMLPFDDPADDPREGDIVTAITEAGGATRDEFDEEFDIVSVNHVGEHSKEHHLEIALVLRSGHV